MTDLPLLQWNDLLDAIVVTTMLWLALGWIRKARSRMAMTGIAVLIGIYLLARALGLELTVWLLERFLAVLVLVVIIVFQEDLRRIFEQIAIWSTGKRALGSKPVVVEILADTCFRMAASRIGALIVIPGRSPLDQVLEGGFELEGRLSEPLLLSLFDPNSPGHDGAVIVRGDRIVRFGARLPLSADEARVRGRGTRHAAAIGLSERTDAICVVISEESGRIAVALDGDLRAVDSREELVQLLRPDSESTEEKPNKRKIHLPNWKESLIALLVVVLVWAFLIPGSREARWTLPAQVVIEKLPPELSLDRVDPPVVEVYVVGPRWRMLWKPPSEATVRIDTLLAALDRRSFEIASSDIEIPDGFTVVSVEPSRVRIEASPSSE